MDGNSLTETQVESDSNRLATRSRHHLIVSMHQPFHICSDVVGGWMWGNGRVDTNGTIAARLQQQNLPHSTPTLKNQMNDDHNLKDNTSEQFLLGLKSFLKK